MIYGKEEPVKESAIFQARSIDSRNVFWVNELGFNTKLLIVNFLLDIFVLTDQPNAKVSSFSSGSPYSGHMSIWLLAIENLSGVNNQGLIGSFIEYEFASFYQLQYAGACVRFFVFLFLAFRFKRKEVFFSSHWGNSRIRRYQIEGA